jgi:hypothetical protein
MPTSTAVLYPQRWVDFSLIHQPGNGTQAIALGVNGRHRAAIESELLSPDQVSVKTGLYIYYVSLYRILFSLCEVSTQWLAGPIIRTSDPLIDFRVHAPVPSIALPVLDKILHYWLSSFYVKSVGMGSKMTLRQWEHWGHAK